MEIVKKVMDFKSKVAEVKKLSKESISLALTAPKEFSFIPGQFISIKIKNQGQVKPRSYSILSQENNKASNKIKLCIKLIPGGFASEVFAKTKVGDEFEVKGPLGHFIYDESIKNKEIWFLGGGTGVAPLCCIIRGTLAKHPEKKFILLFSARTRKDLFLNEEFIRLEKKYSNFKYIPTLTREEWSGRMGRIYKHLPADLKDKTFYICGSKGLIMDVKSYLLENKVNAKDIKIEQCS